MAIFKTSQERLDKKFWYACANSDVPKAEALLAKGANVNAQDKDGHSALYFATRYNRMDIAKFLISKNADVELSDDKAVTPLMIASKQNYSGMVSFLLENKANVHARNYWLQTALHYASTDGTDCIVPLLNNGADINAQDENKNTPLHLSAGRYSCFPAVKLLVEKGGGTSIPNDKGYTPLSIARLNGAVTNAHYLEEIENPKKPAAPATGWKLTAPDEIALISVRDATGHSLTQFFNFHSRLYTQVLCNLRTNAESQSSKFFSDFPDTQILEQAHQELLKQGGKGRAITPHRTVLEK